MQRTGITRKIDELGRIVLPKELRTSLNINAGEDFEIAIDGEKIILTKYSRLDSLEEKIKNTINCFSDVTKYNIFVTIKDKMINYNNEQITTVISNIIQTRKVYINDVIDKNIISSSLAIEGRIVIYPIVVNSDLLGSIIIVHNDTVNNLLNTAKIINNLVKKILLYK